MERHPATNTWDDGRIITMNSAGQRGWDESDPPDGDVADAGEDNWEED